MNQTEDLDVKACKVNVREEATSCVIGCGCCCCQARAIDHRRREGSEGRPWLEAIPRDCDAAIAFRSNDCGYDEGHELAATFCARLPRRSCAQAPQAEARLEEGG